VCAVQKSNKHRQIRSDTMKFLLETALSISGLVIFFVIAFFYSFLFWVGFVFLLVFETAAFVLGYIRRTKKSKQTLKEVIKELKDEEKEK
jgi:type III secretory pathway component EscU